MSSNLPSLLTLPEIQRPSAETLYADELARLAVADAAAPRPEGWKLTPRSVLAFVLGDEAQGISPKFVGSRSLLERCVVALATSRGLMLIGEPGTAKSYLSELLAAAISSDSTLIIQGSAGTTEDAIKYSWNYALLLAEGPTEQALVPAPLHRGMREGKVVRFEEITRCPLEIQDTLLSILSDRVMAIPEREDDGRVLFARVGFNIIATANTRDRGVNEMSAALKRRFNFETIPPIADIHQEMALVQRETERLLQRSGVPGDIAARPDRDAGDDVPRAAGQQDDRRQGAGAAQHGDEHGRGGVGGLRRGHHAYYYGGGQITPAHLLQSLLGSAIKDAPEDRDKLRHYFQSCRQGARRRRLARVL